MRYGSTKDSDRKGHVSDTARAFAERRILDFERLQQLHHPRQLALVETGAGMTDINQ